MSHCKLDVSTYLTLSSDGDSPYHESSVFIMINCQGHALELPLETSHKNEKSMYFVS